MRTVLKLLKYELKLVKEQIESDSEIGRSNSDSYNLKWIRKRKRNTEKYRDELIHEIELLKLRKKQFDLDEYNSKFEQSESNDIENLPEI